MPVHEPASLRRGALGHGLDGAPDVDFLAVDWFALADRQVDELRNAFGITAKAPPAVEAGSVGPWEPGGISPYQYDTARRRSLDAGAPYDSYGATP